MAEETEFTVWVKKMSRSSTCDYCHEPVRVSQSIPIRAHIFLDGHRRQFLRDPGAGRTAYGSLYNRPLPKLYHDGVDVSKHPIILYVPASDFANKNLSDFNQSLQLRNVQYDQFPNERLEVITKPLGGILPSGMDCIENVGKLKDYSPRFSKEKSVAKMVDPGECCNIDIEWEAKSVRIIRPGTFCSYLELVVNRFNPETNEQILPSFNLVYVIGCVLYDPEPFDGINVLIEGTRSDNKNNNSNTVWENDRTLILRTTSKNTGSLRFLISCDTPGTFCLRAIIPWQLFYGAECFKPLILSEDHPIFLKERPKSYELLVDDQNFWTSDEFFVLWFWNANSRQNHFRFAHVRLGFFETIPDELYDKLPENMQRQVDVLQAISGRLIKRVNSEDYFIFGHGSLQMKCGKFAPDPATVEAMLWIKNKETLDKLKIPARRKAQAEINRIERIFAKRGDATTKFELENCCDRIEILRRFEEIEQRLTTADDCDFNVRMTPATWVRREDRSTIDAFSVARDCLTNSWSRIYGRMEYAIHNNAENDRKLNWFRAVVLEKRTDHVLIGIDVEQFNEHCKSVNDANFYFEPIYKNTNDRYVYRAVTLPECRAMLLKYMSPPLCIRDDVDESADTDDSGLNEAQLAFVKTVLASQGGYSMLLQGPPGTGKTRTLAEIIKEVLARNTHQLAAASATPLSSSSDTRPKSEIEGADRILALAPSNDAVDNLVIAALDAEIDKVRIRRLVASSRCVDTMDARVKEVANVRKEECMSGVKQEKEVWFVYQEAKQILRDAEVIFTTVDNSGLFYTDANPIGNFTHLLIDEAGQLSEGHFLIALSAVAKRQPQRAVTAVLAGDVMQLGPVVLTDRNREYKMLQPGSVSPLKKLSTMYKEYDPYGLGRQPSLCGALKINYRGHHTLFEFLNQTRYSDQLQFSEDFDKNKVELIEKIIGLEGGERHAVRFVHVRRSEIDNNSRYVNAAEIATVRYFVEEILNTTAAGASESDIGVLTFYKEQAKALKLALARFKQIKIGTTETWQGFERPIMIVSCVRSKSTRKSVGFLREKPRVTTALSRAKSIEIIVGDAGTLDIDSYWSEFLQYCKRCNIIFEEKIVGGQRRFTALDFKSKRAEFCDTGDGASASGVGQSRETASGSSRGKGRGRGKIANLTLDEHLPPGDLASMAPAAAAPRRGLGRGVRGNKRD